MTKERISVIIPCFNEEGNILPMYKRLKSVLGKTARDYEIIYVNNDSTDNSDRVFKKLAKKDRKVIVISLSRNFYKSQGAYTAGMDYATGDCVVLIDGDLQDPPELIEKFVKKWREGFDVVYGIRKRREEGVSRRIFYKLFYRIFSKLSYLDVPVDAGDFSLMDRRVYKIINSMPERDRYIRGLRAWVGFKHTGVKYTRGKRKFGKTTNSFIDNLRWASLAIFSFSYAPLELISYLAFLSVGLAIIGIAVYVLLSFLFPETPKGFPTLIVAILFLGGVQLLCLSIIGQYLGRMFEEIKGRPKYIIKEILNAPSKLGETSDI